MAYLSPRFNDVSHAGQRVGTEFLDIVIARCGERICPAMGTPCSQASYSENCACMVGAGAPTVSLTPLFQLLCEQKKEAKLGRERGRQTGFEPTTSTV
jgi:hypothetical protein